MAQVGILKQNRQRYREAVETTSQIRTVLVGEIDFAAALRPSWQLRSKAVNGYPENESFRSISPEVIQVMNSDVTHPGLSQ
jgi:hypothetical protein